MLGWSTELTAVRRRRRRHRREVERDLWVEIATGVTSEQARQAVDVSQAVGYPWFVWWVGMAPTDLGSLCGRYLSFVKREEIVIDERKVSGRLGVGLGRTSL